MDPNEALTSLRRDRDQARGAAIALIQAPDYDPESEAVRTAEERAARLDGQVERLAAALAAQDAATVLDARLGPAERATARTEVRERTQSWGDAFVASEEYQGYATAARGRSGIVEVSMPAAQQRALPTGLTDLVSAGINPSTTVTLTDPNAPTPILDAINRVQVSTNAVEFVEWSKVAGGAAKVAEKGAKPSAEWAPSVKSSTLSTIAVYTQLTRQLVEDQAAVRDMINSELVRDVTRAEEADAASVVAGATLPTATGDDLLAAIRMGISAVQTAGYQPSVVMLAPDDWAELDIATMGLTAAGPLVRTSFWGLTPVPVPGMAAGSAIVGDMATAVTQFYRSNVGLYVTDSHAETFLSNVFTLLAERRSLTYVVRPQALVKVSAETP